MKHLSYPVSLALVLLFLAACGHHRDVRPGLNNKHYVAVQADDQNSGAQDAMAQATHYCKEYNKQAVVIKEDAKYVGSMDESTYKNVKTASRVAKGIGNNVFMSDSPNANRDSGRIHSGAGALDDAAGKGYNVRMVFTCR